MHSVRTTVCRVAAATTLVFLAACGGGSSAAKAPTAPSAPTPPAPPPVVGWSVAGVLVDTVGKQPVGGAQLAPSWDLAAVATGADGAFSLGATANPPTTPYRLTVSGSNLVSRELWVGWQPGVRSGITLDVIRDAAPFSMSFYRQLVRGTYDAEGAPWPVLRWTGSPKFYVKTTDQNGRAIETEVLAALGNVLPGAVAAYSSGTLSVAAIETGPDERPEAKGWINISFRRSTSSEQYCGWASVGADPGSITFTDRCACGSNKVAGSLVYHEVGHALGFFHVSDESSVMYPYDDGRCPPAVLSASEKHHVAIAYSRPRGNEDPDRDPGSPYFLDSLPVPRIVRCGLRSVTR